MATDPNHELLGAVRAWAARTYPGCPLEYITIHLRYLPVAIQLAEGPPPAAAPDGAAPPPQGEPGAGGLHPCTADVLAALVAAGRPLTKTKLLELLAERQRAGQAREWSESTVCRRLAELIEDGTVENPPDARPRGYRIAE